MIVYFEGAGMTVFAYLIVTLGLAKMYFIEWVSTMKCAVTNEIVIIIIPKMVVLLHLRISLNLAEISK
jgi:hypothetical protein